MYYRPTIKGVWSTGLWAGKRGSVIDVRAGGLYTEVEGHGVVSGSLEAFIAESGASGSKLLSQLLPAVGSAHLYEGGLREAFASAYCVAHGLNSERLWENPLRYNVDDGGGDRSIIEFADHGARCVGALRSRRSNRELRAVEILDAVPSAIRDDMARIIGLPFFKLEGQAWITDVMWDDGYGLTGMREWPQLYVSGASMFERELSQDDLWIEAALDYYEIPEYVAGRIVDMASRARSNGVAILDRHDWELLIPSGSRGRDEAIELLRNTGRVTLIPL